MQKLIQSLFKNSLKVKEKLLYQNLEHHILKIKNKGDMEKVVKEKELSCIQLKTETGKTRKLGRSIAEKLCLFLGCS